MGRNSNLNKLFTFYLARLHCQTQNTRSAWEWKLKQFAPYHQPTTRRETFTVYTLFQMHPKNCRGTPWIKLSGRELGFSNFAHKSQSFGETYNGTEFNRRLHCFLDQSQFTKWLHYQECKSLLIKFSCWSHTHTKTRGNPHKSVVRVRLTGISGEPVNL